MELFRFFSWAWRYYSTDAKILCCIIIVILGLVPSLFVWGKAALLVFFKLCVAALLIGLVVVLCREAHKAWKAYQRHKEREAEKIVSKLKGQQ